MKLSRALDLHRDIFIARRSVKTYSGSADHHRDPDESAGRQKPTFLPNRRILARVLSTFDAAA